MQFGTIRAGRWPHAVEHAPASSRLSPKRPKSLSRFPANARLPSAPGADPHWAARGDFHLA